jgi:hypothetical protein
MRAKLSRVRAQTNGTNGRDDRVRRGFSCTAEVAPGVRLVLVDIGGYALTLSLWEQSGDVAALTSDATVPARTALVAIDELQLRALAACGRYVDFSCLARSDVAPELHYALLHYGSRREIQRFLQHMLPAGRPATAAA